MTARAVGMVLAVALYPADRADAKECYASTNNPAEHVWSVGADVVVTGRLDVAPAPVCAGCGSGFDAEAGLARNSWTGMCVNCKELIGGEVGREAFTDPTWVVSGVAGLDPDRGYEWTMSGAIPAQEAGSHTVNGLFSVKFTYGAPPLAQPASGQAQCEAHDELEVVELHRISFWNLTYCPSRGEGADAGPGDDVLLLADTTPGDKKIDWHCEPVSNGVVATTTGDVLTISTNSMHGLLRIVGKVALAAPS